MSTADVRLPSALDPAACEAGCDEAGRGCLAGPVVAAAVILPPGCVIEGLTDSKKLTAARRADLRSLIERLATAWAVGICSPREIDEMNILNASIEAMHRALRALAVQPGAIAVDGNRFKPYGTVPHTTVVKGDSKLGNIAAASIIAKTERDAIMERLALECPGYLWEINKGYPTRAHYAALAALGTTPHHRRSFRLTR